MKPSRLMCIGAFVCIVCFIMSFTYDTGGLVFLALCGGAVFGKGYGIWEERNLIRKDLGGR